MLHWLRSQWSRNINSIKTKPREEKAKKKKMKKEGKKERKKAKKKNKHQQEVANPDISERIGSCSSIKNIPLNEYIGLVYRLSKTVHFEAYMQKLGVNFFKRKFAMKMMPTHFVLNFTSDKYILKYFSKLVQIEQKFQLDEETEEKIVDGRYCKILFKYYPPNTLIETQKDMNMVNVIKRIFSKDSVDTILTYDSCVSRMVFRRSFFHGLSRSSSYISICNYVVHEI